MPCLNRSPHGTGWQALLYVRCCLIAGLGWGFGPPQSEFMLYFGAPFAYLLSKLASLPDLAAAPIVPTHPPTAKKTNV